jgi:hypothetical protein
MFKVIVRFIQCLLNHSSRIMKRPNSKAHNTRSELLLIMRPHKLIYKDSKFHSAKPPATTGVTNLN